MSWNLRSLHSFAQGTVWGRSSRRSCFGCPSLWRLSRCGHQDPAEWTVRVTFPRDGGRRRSHGLCVGPDASGVKGCEMEGEQGGPWDSVLGVCLLFGKHSLMAESLDHCQPFSSHAAHRLGLTSDSHPTSERNSLNFSPDKFWSTQGSCCCLQGESEKLNWALSCGCQNLGRRGKPDAPTMCFFLKSHLMTQKHDVYITYE